MKFSHLRHAAGLTAVAVALGASLTACGEASGADSSTFTVGIKPADSASSFLNMADAKEFYADFGCDVELLQLKDSSATMNALVSGEVDAVEESPSQFFIAQQQGTLDAKIVGTWMPSLPYALYAKKGITSLDDLSGATVAISSPTGLPAIVTKEILRTNGVDLDSLTYVNAGGNADRYRAVAAGTADVAGSPADYVPMAKDDGVNVLALSVDTVPDYPRSATIVRSEALKNKPQCVEAYLAGTMKGLRYAWDHPDEAKALAAELLKTTPDDDVVTYMYDEIKDKKLVSLDAELSVSSLQYLADLLADAGELPADFDPSALVDDSYRQAAKEAVDGQG